MVRIVVRSSQLQAANHTLPALLGNDIGYDETRRALRTKQRLRKVAVVPLPAGVEHAGEFFARNEAPGLPCKWRTRHSDAIEAVIQYFAALRVAPIQPSQTGVT